MTYKIQHLLLDLWPRATSLIVAKYFIDKTTVAVKMDGGNPLDLELRCDIIPERVCNLFVVGYDNVGKYYGCVRKFRAPMECLEFLFQHPTRRTNRTGKLEKDEFIGICGFEISGK